MKTHLATVIPNAHGVITDAASLLKNYKNFVLQFDALTPVVPGDQCQIQFGGGGLPGVPDPSYAFGVKGGSQDLWGMSQTYGVSGTGVIGGDLTICDPADAKAPGVVAKGQLTCDGVATEMITVWLRGLTATSFTISYPGGIKSGSVEVYGVKQ